PRIEPVESAMLRRLMSVRAPLHLVIALLVVGITLSACGATTLRELAGLPKVDEPRVESKAAETKWQLIKDPRLPDIASEPEYMRVEEDKIPTTIGTLVFGKSSLIASPEIVAKYGAPPGGGRISPRQKVAVATEPTAPPAKGAVNTTGKGGTQPAAAPLPTNRGFVVFVDTRRVVLAVGPEMRAIEEAIARQLDSPVSLIREMGDFIAGAGGKRLRPILLLMASRVAGYSGPRAVRMGCVVELLHTATLIHDDVVDQAPLRRGRPSANARWGDDASILVGDHLYSKSFALMVEDGDPAVLETLARATVSMTEAEVLQLERKRTGSASEADY